MNQKSFWNRILNSSILSTMLFAFFVFSGCGESIPPTGIDLAPEIDLLSEERKELSTVPRSKPTRGLFVQRIMGPRGGTVHCWHHSLTIPENALSLKCWVSISWPEFSSPILDFGPNELNFHNDQPAVIRISYKGGIFGDFDEASLHVNEWDADRAEWNNIGGTINSKKKYVEVRVTRLSRYALSDR